LSLMLFSPIAPTSLLEEVDSVNLRGYDEVDNVNLV
jgi:hypothetical protein